MTRTRSERASVVAGVVVTAAAAIAVGAYLGVALRRLGGKEQEVLALGEAIARLKREAAVPSSSFRPNPVAAEMVHQSEESVNS